MQEHCAVIIYDNNGILSGINGAYSHETLNHETKLLFIDFIKRFSVNSNIFNEDGSIDYIKIKKFYRKLNYFQNEQIYQFYKEHTNFLIKKSHDGMYISKVNNKLDIIKGKQEVKDNNNLYNTVAREIAEEVKFKRHKIILNISLVKKLLSIYFSKNKIPFYKKKINNRNYNILFLKKELLESIVNGFIVISKKNLEFPNHTELFDLRFRRLNKKYKNYQWNTVVKEIFNDQSINQELNIDTLLHSLFSL